MCLKTATSVIIGVLLFAALLYSDEASVVRTQEAETQYLASLLWRYPTGGRIITPPVEGSDGTLYFVSEDRFLYALKADGTLKWRTNLEERMTDTLALAYDGTIYVGSKKGYLIAVNPFGEELWKIKLKGEPFGAPAVEPNGSLFLVTENGWLYSMSHTGFIRWEVKLPSYPVLSPVSSSNIYIALGNDRIYAYTRDGTNTWTFLLSGEAKSLSLSTNSIYAGTSNSTLVSIDLTGKRLWNISLSGRVDDIVVLTEDRIVCAQGNSIAMLDSFGNSLWTVIGKRSSLDLAAISNQIISIDTEGYVAWFDINGRKISQLKGGLPSGRALFASDGAVYLGSRDWLFYKYGFRDLINSDYTAYIWPSFRAGIEKRGYLAPGKEENKSTEISLLPDYVYLNELAGSNDEKLLNGLLDEVEKRLYVRDYDSGKSYLLDILETLASDCVKRPLYEEGILVNNFPLIRSRAIDILGITGNFETIEFLADLLDYEWDTYITNSNIRSLGNLQSDSNAVITNSLVSYYNKHHYDMSSRTLSQLLITVQRMNLYNGSSNIDLLGMITDILLKASSRPLKELALATINSIKK